MRRYLVMTAALGLALTLGFTIAPGPAAGPRAAGPRTIPAATCSQQDVQAAIDKAADGDTVAVPAGTAVWKSPGRQRPENAAPHQIIVYAG